MMANEAKRKRERKLNENEIQKYVQWEIWKVEEKTKRLHKLLQYPQGHLPLWN